jgi:signal transduction histidine kinase
MSTRVRQRLLDLAPSVALLAAGLAQLATAARSSGFRGPAGANAAFLVAVCAPVTVRRRRPVPALAGVFAVQAAWLLALYRGPDQPPAEPFFAGVVACFALGLHADRRGLRAGLAIFAAAVLVSAITLASGGATIGNALPVLVWWGAAVVIGRGLRERQTLVELLRERSARLELDRERDVAQAASEERARIARELHDVIAHAVSLIVVQASAERRLLSAEQRRTADTLDAIESAGREALGELRRLLGVLRAHGEERLAPQPGLAALPELLAEGRAGGHAICLRVDGAPVQLPPGLDLTAYRIVQEALTNARKHAPHAALDVSLRWHPGLLEIEVADDGPGPSPRANGHGHGLIGMRERVALYGGSVHAEHTPGQGFRVRARLPIEAA